jgi:hypothetical protein
MVGRTGAGFVVDEEWSIGSGVAALDATRPFGAILQIVTLSLSDMSDLLPTLYLQDMHTESTGECLKGQTLRCPYRSRRR